MNIRTRTTSTTSTRIAWVTRRANVTRTSMRTDKSGIPIHIRRTCITHIGTSRWRMVNEPLRSPLNSDATCRLMRHTHPQYTKT